MLRIFILAFLIFCARSIASAQIDTVYSDANEEPLRLFVLGNRLYITTVNEVRWINHNQKNSIPTSIFSSFSEWGDMVVFGGEIYIVQFRNGKILKFNPMDSIPSLTGVVPGLLGPNGLALDSNWLYFSESLRGTIRRVNLTIRNFTPQLIADSLNFPGPMLIHNRNLYVSEIGGDKVTKLSLDTLGISSAFISSIDKPMGLEEKNDTLYICEYDSSRIVKTSLLGSGGPLITVLDSVGEPTGLEFIGKDLFIADHQRGYVLKLLNTIVNNHNFKFKKSHLYPNPANEAVYISNREKAIHYRLFDFQGKLLSQRKLHPNQAIDVSGLSKGIYFIQLENEEMRKLIKL